MSERETAERDVQGRAGQGADERRKRSTAATPSAREIAARLWAPPDPVNFCKRRIVADVAAFDQRLRELTTLRDRLDAIFFDDLSRLWIPRPESADLLDGILAQARDLVRLAGDASDCLNAICMENSLRFNDELALERDERERGRG